MPDSVRSRLKHLAVALIALPSIAHAGLYGDLLERDRARHRTAVSQPSLAAQGSVTEPPVAGLPFTSGELFSIRTPVSDVAVGDLDGDGADELVAVEPDIGRVSVWKSSSRLLLSEFVIQQARHVAVADLVGDAILDLAVASGRALHLWRGLGNGTFVAEDTITVGGSTTDLVSADFDGDGRADLAVSSAADSTVYVLRGTLQGPDPPHVVVRDAGPGTLSTFDLPGGGADLVAAYGSWRVRRFHWQPTGHWSTVWTIQTFSDVSQALLRDLDGDGHPELAIVHPTPLLEVLRGDPAGGFSSRDSLKLHGWDSYGDNPAPVLASADVDGNGSIELFVGVRGDYNQAWVHGVEVTASDVVLRTSYFVGPGGIGRITRGAVTALAVTDLDADGGRDLVVGAEHDGHQLFLLPWLRGLAYAGVQQYVSAVNESHDHLLPTKSIHVHAIASAIRVSDSPRDALLMSVSDRSVVVRWTPEGIPATVAGAPGNWHHTALDLDGDGWADFVRIFGDFIQVTRGNPNGTPSLETNYYEGRFLTFGDFDGDDDWDAVTREASGNLRVLANDGAGHFIARTLTAIVPEHFRDVDAGDLNGDGLDDLVFGTWLMYWGLDYEGVACLISTGDDFQSWAFPRLVKPATSFPTVTRMVLCRDMDGDERADIITLNGSEVDAPNWIIVLINRGDRAFEQLATLEVLPEDQCLVADDLDGDGDVDCAASSYRMDGGRLQVWLNDGLGALEERGLSPEGEERRIGLDHHPRTLAVGRFDDGPSPDLAILGTGFSMLLNTKLDVATAVHVSLASVYATAEQVALEWLLTGSDGQAVDVWREQNSEVTWLGPARLVGADRVAFEDRDVLPGTTASYRLRYAGGGEWLGEWFMVAIPQSSDASEFALSSPQPNPSIGGPVVRLRVAPGMPAELSLHDVAGRRFRHHVIPAGAGGPASVDFSTGRALEPGIYWITLKQGPQSAVVRTVVVR